MKRRGGQALLGIALLAAAARAEPVELRIIDADGTTLEPGRTHASFSRTLPPELGSVPGPDRDALRFLLIAAPDSSLKSLEVLSLGAAGRPLDANGDFPTEPATCPDGVAPELVCRQTLPLRLVATELDRAHPATKRRTILATLGGTVRLSLGGQKLIEIEVAGPRAARATAFGNLRPRLRVLILRSKAGSAPAVGGTDAGAKQLMQNELASASAIWAQCGIDLLASSIDVVDPPSSQLASVGCGLGQPASGGWLRLQNGARKVALETHAGESPVNVALRLADALSSGRTPAQVFENQRDASDALPSADVLLGAASKWQAAANQPLSSDPTLPLCLGRVDLNDGLLHFGDGNAFSGTLEERSLLRAFDDGDPRSIELFVVPGFDSAERIGESFIVSAGSSLSSSVIIDRSAIWAGARSFALAHELGHVLLAMPGHPDDFGVDQSWSLMDADVADPTVFGPRRLSSADCERALTQAGPRAFTPLLEPLSVVHRPKAAR
jgi:hypothetical protein